MSMNTHNQYISVMKFLILSLIGISLGTVHVLLSILLISIGIGYQARKWYVFEKEQNRKSVLGSIEPEELKITEDDN